MFWIYFKGTENQFDQVSSAPDAVQALQKQGLDPNIRFVLGGVMIIFCSLHTALQNKQTD